MDKSESLPVWCDQDPWAAAAKQLLLGVKAFHQSAGTSRNFFGKVEIIYEAGQPVRVKVERSHLIKGGSGINLPLSPVDILNEG